MDLHRAEIRLSTMARELELEWKCTGSKSGRQPRFVVERESERRVVVCQDYRGISVFRLIDREAFVGGAG